ncbi:MAG: class B sortase [Eubacteriales bacterium]|nr:class B sortase [Eubacteriales bacterium]MDD3883147.1 class B sortase [Eubacteriales bacterium]MDD4512683.1 class B sortase [Eubacteriales bacterium]
MINTSNGKDKANASRESDKHKRRTPVSYTVFTDRTGRAGKKAIGKGEFLRAFRFGNLRAHAVRLTRRKDKPAAESKGAYDYVTQYSPRRKRKSPLQGRYTILAVICAAVFLVSAIMLINYFLQYSSSTSVSNSLRNEYKNAEQDNNGEGNQSADFRSEDIKAEETASATGSLPAETATPSEPPYNAAASYASAFMPYPSMPPYYPDNVTNAIKLSFRQVRETNRDIVAWLTIDGVVDEAVVHRDNTFYLTHDYLGQKNANGALFMDEQCSLLPVPNHIVVYGHNMKTGAMFVRLILYKTKGLEYLKKHGIVTFNTMYEDAQYVVFAVMQVHLDPADRHFFNFFTLDFANDDSYKEYILRAKALSMYTVPVSVEPGDRLLSLVTCIGENNDDERLVLLLRKLRDTETERDAKTALDRATNN